MSPGTGQSMFRGPPLGNLLFFSSGVETSLDGTSRAVRSLRIFGLSGSGIFSYILCSGPGAWAAVGGTERLLSWQGWLVG